MKDAKGHGSEGRGGSPGAGGPLSKGVKGDMARQLAEATIKFGMSTGGLTVEGAKAYLAEHGGGQPVASNAHAAATLAGGGTKSAPVDTHPAMSDSARSEAYVRSLSPYEAGAVDQNGKPRTFQRVYKD